jgi:hypothetical protein
VTRRSLREDRHGAEFVLAEVVVRVTFVLGPDDGPIDVLVHGAAAVFMRDQSFLSRA